MFLIAILFAIYSNYLDYLHSLDFITKNELKYLENNLSKQDYDLCIEENFRSLKPKYIHWYHWLAANNKLTYLK